MSKITVFLNKLPKLVIFLLGIFLVLIIGVFDYLLAWDVYLFIFYLLPIYLVAWYVGKWAGIFISVCSAGVWFMGDLTSVIHTYSQPVAPYWNVMVVLGFFLIVSLILDRLKTVLTLEAKSARTDFLTKVPNRRYFFEIAGAELNRTLRYKHPLTLAYIDLDNFKNVNDLYGHNVGDLLLFLVAKTIRNNIRVVDTVSRLGGDEFAVMFPETGAVAAEIVVAKIRKKLLELMQSYKWPVTFSIGIATFVNGPATVDEMLKNADKLMYEVKNNGKNTVKHQVFEN